MLHSGIEKKTLDEGVKCDIALLLVYFNTETINTGLYIYNN